MKLTYEHIIQHHMNNVRIDVPMAAYTASAPGWRQQVAAPDFYRFCYIVSGTGWLQLGNKEYITKPGQLYLLPAGVEQAFGTLGEEPFVRYWCHFRANIGDRQLVEMMNVTPYVRVDDAPALTAIFNKLLEAHRSDGITRGMRIRAATMEMLAYYLDRCTFKEMAVPEEGLGKLNDVLAYIEANLTNNITIEDLARVAFLHPNYFIVYFKNVLGCSPIHYVNERRMEKAKQLLAQTDNHVSEVALQVGMQNHYLSRQFKTYTGLTPNRYRKLFKNIHGHAGSNSLLLAAAEEADIFVR